MTSGRPVTYSAISSYSRVEILQLLQTQPDRTVSDIVEATHLHPNTVREHLQRLIDSGYIVATPEHRKTRGRPRVLYSAADGTRTSSNIQHRRVREAAARGDLMRRVLPGSAGHLELQALHQIDAVVEDLIDAGFDPLIDEDQLIIELTPCTHALSSDAHHDVVWAVHLGLIQAVLNEAGGPLSVDGLRSSCVPGQCIIALTHAASTH